MGAIGICWANVFSANVRLDGEYSVIKKYRSQRGAHVALTAFVDVRKFPGLVNIKQHMRTDLE